MVNNLRKQLTKETTPQVITIEINIETTEPRGDNPNQSQLHPSHQFPFPSQFCLIPLYPLKQPIKQKQIIHFLPQCSNYRIVGKFGEEKVWRIAGDSPN